MPGNPQSRNPFFDELTKNDGDAQCRFYHLSLNLLALRCEEIVKDVKNEIQHVRSKSPDGIMGSLKQAVKTLRQSEPPVSML